MRKAQEFTKAFAYVRTSSASNVRADKDSDKRQLTAIQDHARRAGIEIVGTFKDEAVSGADPIDTRAGFTAMLERIEGTGVRTILVETASRFARDLMVQEVGFALLSAREINIIAADSPTAFLDETPTARLIRQVLGAVSEFEKAMLVAKLKGARDRKRQPKDASGRLLPKVKVEGRKSIDETKPEVVKLAKKLSRRSPKGGKLSLRQISEGLAKSGHLTNKGTHYTATSIARILGKESIHFNSNS